MRNVIVLVVLFVCLPALASEPGQPLDCSDWVFLEPGLSCGVFMPYRCSTSSSDPLWCTGAYTGGLGFIDNEGVFYRVTTVDLALGVDCGGHEFNLHRTQIMRFDGGDETVVAYVDDRCSELPGEADKIKHSGTRGYTNAGNLTFDDKYGRLYMPLISECDRYDGVCSNYYDGYWLSVFEGFTTTFEVLQTYEPTSGPISFRVPYMPEGFPAADFFDTYWGDLTTVGDWSQAQPLQCGFPATSPAVGDYLEVEDTLPALEPSQGRYYVTAVTNEGQRRYGRKRDGGNLTGRDPALLPGCGE